MVAMHVRKQGEALPEPGRADLPVSLDARQRGATAFSVPMRSHSICRDGRPSTNRRSANRVVDPRRWAECNSAILESADLR